LRRLSWTANKRGFARLNAIDDRRFDLRLGSGDTIESFSPSAYQAMREQTRAFEALTCWQRTDLNLPVVAGERGRIEVELVCGNYFRTLGVATVSGPNQSASIGELRVRHS
jgi:hypothetical protein